MTAFASPPPLPGLFGLVLALAIGLAQLLA